MIHPVTHPAAASSTLPATLPPRLSIKGAAGGGDAEPAPLSQLASGTGRTEPAKREELRKVFGQFVGETFYGQMLKAMRKTVGKPAYFHGGHAEEVFQSQLDQALAEQMTEASADRFVGPMFERQFPQR